MMFKFNSETLDNLENLIFSGISRNSGSDRQKLTSDLDFAGQNTLT